jgi:hypothetical protein
MKDSSNLADIKFTFRCEQKWEDLEITANTDVRFCDRCNYKVHYITHHLDLQKLDLGEKCVALKTPDTEKGVFILGGIEKPLPKYPPIKIFVFSCGYISRKQLETLQWLERHFSCHLEMKQKNIRFKVRFKVGLSQLEELDRIINILEKEEIIYAIEEG